jgi:hypothetical protein
MAFIADTIYDNGLSYAQTNGTRLDITSTEATTYAQATSTLTLGNDAVVTAAPSNGAVDGRRVQVPAITAGSVTGTGTAAFWALTDGVGELLATGTITSQGVTSGNTFSLTAISITLRDATAA